MGMLARLLRMPFSMYGFDLEDGSRISVSAITVPVVREHADVYLQFYLNLGGVPA